MARYRFRLFVTGFSINSKRAVNNLNRLCREQFGQDAEVRIIDIAEEPATAEEEHILVTPTLIRDYPLPQCRIIGDLSHREVVLQTLLAAEDQAGNHTGDEPYVS
jgi:circadian clock protein KaiB